MTCPSDQLLAAQVRQGDERAFVTLVRRYERVLARLIGQYIGTATTECRDVLQETMASAWSALRRDTPRDVRAWIMQVARNRCRDYFRSTQRRELFVEDQTLELMVNRRGMAQARQRATASEVVEAKRQRSPWGPLLAGTRARIVAATEYRLWNAPNTSKRELTWARWLDWS